MRAAVYARYSSDLQREASIEDQLRLCREAAASRGWTVVNEYADRAASGSSRFRPEYQQLLTDAKAGKFDFVVAEALDRLSRDQEDVAALYKALIFADVTLVTLAEGEISELHVGLKGTMNALFLRDLAAKTHRGLRGRVEQGRSAGGKAFGYQVAKEVDAEGDRVRGKRLIDADEAIIVRRIYSDFSTGSSPRAIATRLNQEGIAGPGGRPWQDTTIRGHGGRGTGILRNELYAGRLVWNRMRFLKDPATGKRVSRPNPPSEWIVEDVPELRIVDDALWEKVSDRLADIAASPTAQAIKANRFWEKKRAKHVLTGLAVCGCCGHPLAAVGKDYLRCSRAHRNGLCTNKTGVKRGVLEEIVISAMQHNLMAPELVAEFISAFHAEVNASRGEADAERRRAEKRKAEIERQLDGLITAIAEGLRSSGLQQRLDALEAERAQIETTLAAPAPSPIRLHPNLAELYRRKVAALHEALRDPNTQAEALEIMRSLIEQVIVHPREAGGFEVELVGEIASMVEVAMGGERKNAALGGAALDAGSRRSVKVVAGTCNHRELTLRCSV
jgi:site-specific DNA recombinase